MTTAEIAITVTPKMILMTMMSDGEEDISCGTNLQVLLLNVRMAIKQALPDATEKISWQMPTFWKGHNLIHFAAQKNHLGIYPGVEAIKHFAPRLTGYKTSKGTTQFPYKSLGTEQIDLIAEIAAWCGDSKK